ncbi:MAG: choice-of-anchor tandem repeat GloVer-containing protein [Candidatus Korobacteraceae bacterium]|jgi:uncharacterized repeat protein (TIGR03803 family)
MKIKHTSWTISSLLGRAVLFALGIVLLLGIGELPGQAQTFKVLHTFTGGGDGAYPQAPLTMDGAGNIYGAAYSHGASGLGTVFRLQPKNTSWIFTPLYSFPQVIDGAYPVGVALGPDGSIYGATYFGGEQNDGCGVVFNVRPPPTRPPTPLSPWTETVLHVFEGNDGCDPESGVSFDQAGNLYGTTPNYGPYNAGVVFQMSRDGSSWNFQLIHAFSGNDGTYPLGPVVFDSDGNLYGNAAFGGPGDAGTIYLLAPSGGNWVFTRLTDFPESGDGFRVYGGVIVDHAGNVYGGTVGGGSGGGGTVFMISRGNWNFNVLQSLQGGGGPIAAPTMDAAGNLYSTSSQDGAYGYGNVFKLTPSNGSWTYTDLYDFTGGADGGGPTALVFAADGNLYGFAENGGSGSSCAYGCGTIFEITP